jgi:hypothetical protein
LTAPSPPLSEKFGKTVYIQGIGCRPDQEQSSPKPAGRRFAGAKFRILGRRRSRRVAGGKEEQDVD